MSRLADLTGAYAFIPDPAFVGTVFVNALSNLLTTYASKVSLTLTPFDGTEIFAVPGYEMEDLGQGKKRITLGTLQLGQDRHVVVRARSQSGTARFSAEVHPV